MSAKVAQMTDLMTFKNRQDLHLARKIWHVLTVLFMFSIYHFAPLEISFILLILIGGAGVVFDFIRLRNKKVNDFAFKILGPIMRDTEAHAIAGTTSLIIGVFFIVCIFPKSIVEMSLLFLALADPAASYVGIRYGKDKLWNRKSLQGTLAGFFVCTLISLVYFYSTDIMIERLMIVSLLAGLVGSLAEAIPIAKLDDNFVMPVLSAAGLWMIFSVFGGFLA